MSDGFARLKARVRWVSLLLVLLLMLGSIPNGGAALPLPQEPVLETVELPPEAFSLSSRFAPDRKRVGNPKLDSAMNDIAAAAQVSLQAANDAADAQMLRVSGSRVQVQIAIQASGAQAVADAIAKAGGEVTGVGNDETLIQAWIPADELETVAALEDVYLIRRPAEAVLSTRLQVGNSTTEGLAAMNGPAWHTAGQLGAGTKVGIIDGGFIGYPGLQGTDLPASVTVQNFVDGETIGQVDGTTEHGTACAEIVHDVAPGAALYLAKTSTNIDLREAVNWLTATHQVDIISTSLGWYNLTPGDGTGEFEDLVQAATAAGVLWTTAASNDRENHWGGSFADADSDDVHEFNGKQINCFGPAGTSCYNINPGFAFRVFLRWDDWTNVDQDYDLFLVRWSGSTWEEIAFSVNWQDGSPGQTPTEFAVGVTSGSATPYGIVIERYDSTRAVHFELFAPKFPRLNELTHARSLANLADAPSAMTVAALDSTSPYPQEDYSSEGPANGPGGTATGGAIKPDISAYANVATESYPGSTFNGTSAATPHVAGAAALVLGLNPGYTPAQLRSFLEGRAIGMGSPGKDTVYGYGRLYLDTPPPPAPIVTSIAPATGLNTGTVHITNLAGSNFQSGAAVALTRSGQSDIDATGVTVVSASQITCDLDLTGAAAGQWNVVVTNTDTQSGVLPNGFTVNAPAPAVSSIVPSEGPNTGVVHITNLAGSNFQSGAAVALTRSGQSDIDATNVAVVGASQITCDLDLTGAAAGQWNVVVTNPGGQSGQLSNGFAVKAVVFLPLVLRNAAVPDTPAKPAGHWTGTGVSFDVTSDRQYVDNFRVTVVVSIPGGTCLVTVTRISEVPIANNQFSFSGSFYASGTFDSETTAHGTFGFNHHPACGGTITGSDSWTATWASAGSSSLPHRADGSYFMEPGMPVDGFLTFTPGE